VPPLTPTPCNQHPPPRSYKFTKEDIQRKLAARREKGEVVGGIVTEKARVRGLLEAAESAGDVEQAAQ
jgi:hypothetical protein